MQRDRALPERSEKKTLALLTDDQFVSAMTVLWETQELYGLALAVHCTGLPVDDVKLLSWDYIEFDKRLISCLCTRRGTMKESPIEELLLEDLERQKRQGKRWVFPISMKLTADQLNNRLRALIGVDFGDVIATATIHLITPASLFRARN